MKIFCPNINNPETLAMLQALYSRSHKSIEEHLVDMDSDNESQLKNEEKLKNSLKKYYLNYGHESIADCGSTTLFIEDVSIIAAKAIQETNLYNGQESSTRYIDFSTKEDSLKSLLNDNENKDYVKNKDLINSIIKDYFTLYHSVFNHTFNYIKNTKFEKDYNLTPNEKRAVEAFSFDVARGFLPSGTTTQLSFHGTLRGLRKHFLHLKKHPFNEVRQIATQALSILYSKYPNSFKEEDSVPYKDHYSTDEYFVFDISSLSSNEKYNLLYTFKNNTDVIVKNNGIHHNSSYMNGNVLIISNKLDYGSWRDLQRHRNGFCYPTIPQFKPNSKGFNIHDWYMSYLDDMHFDRLYYIIKNLEKLETNLDSDTLLNYLLPLGTKVDYIGSYNVEEIYYIMDLRLRDTVHPTLTQFLSDVVNKLTLTEYYNKVSELSNREFSLKRGKQTIFENDKAISDKD